MGKPENSVEAYLARRCKALRWEQFKFTAPGRRGVPDRVVMGNGYTAFIELKSADGSLSPIQKAVIPRMRRAGAIVFVCPSKADVDKALDILAALPPGPGYGVPVFPEVP